MMLGREEVERILSAALGGEDEYFVSPRFMTGLCRMYLAVLDAPCCTYEGEMHGTRPTWSAPIDYDGPEVGQRVRILPAEPTP
jgi:hypothetical protein